MLDGLAPLQLLKEPSGRPGVAAALRQQFENLAFIVDRAPESHVSAVDPADHFVQMPAWRRGRAQLLQESGDGRSELLVLSY
ncbi:hypothetical protein AQ619_07020 [Caulobacter henricii]|uniref:Uncharacterized protein n=1 Tax=Caulobacter henricii TaxID=69395 RepID=A0A0P0NZF5_9CAUL|nr:hypothetical protein AQ619_07020 [Caulobacter henricii]